MNQPGLLTVPFVLLCVVFLNSLGGCNCGDPVNDDTSKPADGDSEGGATDTGSDNPGAPAAAGDGDGDPAPTCEAELERVKAELAECQAPK